MHKSTLLFFILFVFSVNSFGQIKDPAPNFDSEPFRTAQNQWEFSKKPYKKITTIKQNRKMISEEFDSIGRSVLHTGYSSDYDQILATTYKNNMMIAVTRKQIYKADEKGIKKDRDEIFTNALNFDKNGEIIDGTSTVLAKDGTYKITGHSFYDKQNRLIKSIDTLGIRSINNYYLKRNLIKQEVIYQKDKNNKSILEKTYKYDKDNQIYFSETSNNTYLNDQLTEKKIVYTVHQTFKNKLIVKKVLISTDFTYDRTYKYDSNKNLIYFLEIKKNTNDGSEIYQIKTSHKFENNRVVHTDHFDGSSDSNGRYSFSDYIYAENGTLSKKRSTYDVQKNKQAEVSFFYNQYNHIIKIDNVYFDTNSHTQTTYEIEYY